MEAEIQRPGFEDHREIRRKRFHGRPDPEMNLQVVNIFLKMGQPRPLLSFIFGLFKETSLQILHQINVKKCPSSIRCRDLNPRPLDMSLLP